MIHLYFGCEIICSILHRPYKKPLLFNMEFVLVGSFKKPRGDLERLIQKLGGKVGAKIHDGVAAIVSNVKKVRKMGKRMKKARKYNVQVVSEDFLDEIQKPGADPIQYINSKSISNWAGDVSDCIKSVIQKRDICNCPEFKRLN